MYKIKKFKDNIKVKEFISDSYVQTVIDDMKSKRKDTVTFEQNILVDGTVYIKTSIDSIHYTVEVTEETGLARREHDLELLAEVVKELLKDELEAYCTISVGRIMTHQHYILTYGRGDKHTDILIPEKDIHMYSQARLVAKLKEELNGSI